MADLPVRMRSGSSAAQHSAGDISACPADKSERKQIEAAADQRLAYRREREPEQKRKPVGGNPRRAYDRGEEINRRQEEKTSGKRCGQRSQQEIPGAGKGGSCRDAGQ